MTVRCLQSLHLVRLVLITEIKTEHTFLQSHSFDLTESSEIPSGLAAFNEEPFLALLSFIE
jgi:hypothetical protein